MSITCVIDQHINLVKGWREQTYVLRNSLFVSNIKTQGVYTSQGREFFFKVEQTFLSTAC